VFGFKPQVGEGVNVLDEVHSMGGFEFPVEIDVEGYE
jgi:hypothetical protein